jgi:hypothetical protein
MSIRIIYYIHQFAQIFFLLLSMWFSKCFYDTLDGVEYYIPNENGVYFVNYLSGLSMIFGLMAFVGRSLADFPSGPGVFRRAAILAGLGLSGARILLDEWSVLSNVFIFISGG